MAKLDPKQQLAVREILEALEAVVPRVFPGLANLPAAAAADLLANSPERGTLAAVLARAIKAAKELDAAH